MADLSRETLQQLSRIAVRNLNDLSRLWERAEGNMSRLASWLRFKFNLESMDAARKLIDIGVHNADTWLTRFKLQPDRATPWIDLPRDPSLPWYRHRGSDFVYRTVLESGGEFTTVWVRSKSELSYNSLRARALRDMGDTISNSPRLSKIAAPSRGGDWEVVEINPARRE